MRDMAQTLSLTDITKDFGGGPVLAGISLDICLLYTSDAADE